jgi:hypothetical protein
MKELKEKIKELEQDKILPPFKKGDRGGFEEDHKISSNPLFSKEGSEGKNEDER